jgi:hypothetical protein
MTLNTSSDSRGTSATPEPGPSPKHQSKKAFVLSFGADVPIADVIAAGKRAHLKIVRQYVHTCRWNARNAGVSLPVGGAPAPAPAPVARASTELEQAFELLVVRIGTARVQQLITAMTARHAADGE